MTIKQIFKILLSRIYLIVAIPLISIVGAIIIVFNFVEPTYTAFTTVFVLNKKDDANSISYSDLNASLALTNDYREIATSAKVLDSVAQEFGYSSKGQLRSKYSITVSSVSETRIIKISVSSTDQDKVADIANSIGKNFKIQAVKIMDVDNVEVVDTAVRPSLPSAPNKTASIAIAGVAGLVFSLAIVLLIEALNTTIRTPEDVEKALSLPILAKIPKMEEVQ